MRIDEEGVIWELSKRNGGQLGPDFSKTGDEWERRE